MKMPCFVCRLSGGLSQRSYVFSLFTLREISDIILNSYKYQKQRKIHLYNVDMRVLVMFRSNG